MTPEEESIMKDKIRKRKSVKGSWPRVKHQRWIMKKKINMEKFYLKSYKKLLKNMAKIFSKSSKLIVI